MKQSQSEAAIRRINYLASEMDALYHQASLRLNISDSVSIVLYTIYDKGDGCLLSDVYKSSGISKQTVNSAIRGLERDGILTLTAYTGRSKQIRLTPKGMDYLQTTAARLAEAEKRAFDAWTDAEICAYVGMAERYVEAFRTEIQKIK